MDKRTELLKLLSEDKISNVIGSLFETITYNSVNNSESSNDFLKHIISISGRYQGVLNEKRLGNLSDDKENTLVNKIRASIIDLIMLLPESIFEIKSIRDLTKLEKSDKNAVSLISPIINVINAWCPTKDSMSLIIIDIDDYSAINLKYGDAIGDKIKIKSEEIFESTIDKIKELGYYNPLDSNIEGGWLGKDEYYFIFKNIEPHYCVELAKLICREFRNFDWNSLDNRLRVTVSIGVSKIFCNKILEYIILTLLKVKQAKSEGKNKAIWKMSQSDILNEIDIMEEKLRTHNWSFNQIIQDSFSD